MQLRKIIRTRGHFPTDEAAVKLLWLALRNVLAKSVRHAYDWKVRDEPVCHPVRRPIHPGAGVTVLLTASPTKTRTGSSTIHQRRASTSSYPGHASVTIRSIMRISYNTPFT
jgi:hypothetical protein